MNLAGEGDTRSVILVGYGRGAGMGRRVAPVGVVYFGSGLHRPFGQPSAITRT